MATHSFGAGYHAKTGPRARPVYARHACVYCGLEGTAAKGGPLGKISERRYACRDALACGERIRARRRAAGIPDDDSDLPF